MISERLDYLSRAACPVCGDDRETVFRRDPLTNDLVCRAHFPRHTFAETVKPADVWESWSIDLEVDRLLEEGI
jgi:hypothetical protein